MANKKAFSFMALGKTHEAREFVRELYKGVGAVNILAVNPTREEQNRILNSERSTEPINYIGTTKVKDAQGNEIEVPQVRITFIVRTDPEIACNNGIETTQLVSFFISKTKWWNKDFTKFQVIDKYGRTAWVTPEEFEAHKVPTYTVKAGELAGETRQINISADYRAAYQGEDDLMKNIKAFLVISRPDPWDNATKQYVMSKDPQVLADAECLLDTWDDIFKGDVSEIRDAIMSVPKQAYRLMFGVRTRQDGTQNQVFYIREPLTLATMKYDTLQKDLVSDMVANLHTDTVYKAGPLEKFTLAPTDYSQQDVESQAESTDDNDLPADDTNPFEE